MVRLAMKSKQELPEVARWPFLKQVKSILKVRFWHQHMRDDAESQSKYHAGP